MEGCAGEMMGEMASREGGKGEACEGKRMGDMKGLPQKIFSSGIEVETKKKMKHTANGGAKFARDYQ